MTFFNQQEQIEEIRRVMNKLGDTPSLKGAYLLIVIHSLDMGQLKQPKALETLALLAACKHIRLVVSLDNCKAGVLFTDRLLDSFNFVNFQMDTFEEFGDECSYQPSLFSQKNENQEIGLAFIFKSMTDTQKGIIMQIAKY